MSLQLTTRNADLQTLTDILKDQRVRRLDVVVPAERISSHAGRLEVPGTETVMDESGVTSAAGFYTPTAACDSLISDKLGIGLNFLRWMRENRLDMYDATINALLHGGPVPAQPGTLALDEDGGLRYPADDRRFLLRLLRGDDALTGVARAFLSERYAVIDNLDVLVEALKAMRESGVTGQVTGCDLTDSRMYVKVEAPEVKALAPRLLEGYRSPFGGGQGSALPIVSAGFVLGNSETGHGSFSVTPRITVQVCRNGMTMTRDALRSVHLGGKLEEGVITWSAETQRRALELVASKTRDAVTAFLSKGYLEGKVAEMEQESGVQVSHPANTIREVVKAAKFPQAVEDDILNHFIRGGQLTAGGVMQAVTAAAQEVADADLSADMEAGALTAMATAARIG